ncbi:MAG TPA: CpaE family protein [Caulobacteraceae bacterium]|jgi:pilus assembly protein CpaE
MRPQPNHHDDFDAGFEASDDFAFGASDSWAERALADAEAAARAPRPVEEAQENPFTAPPDSFAASVEASPPAAAPEASALSLEPPSAPPSGDERVQMVPRISVHAFCEKPQTAAVFEHASRDRRMARTTTQVRPGGLAAAIQHYANQPTPPLVVVESADRGEGLLSQLDRLSEVCDPGTKVMVIGAANDIALYRELMRRGVSEYLVPPLQPLQVIGAISGLFADPSSPFLGRQIAFAGAKGGVGASTIAHNFAYSLSERMQANTVMVDFDLAFGTAGLDFNQDPLQGMANALSQPDRLDPVLLERMMARCTDRLSLFSAPATLDEDYDFSADAAEEVASKIRSTAPFIVLDLPHQWGSWMRRVLLTSDEVVIVATPDLAALRNAKNMIDLLKQARPNDSAPRLVLNQVGVPGRPEIPVKDYAAALGMQPALVLPFDPKLFGKAANNGQMIHEIAPTSKTAEGLDHLAQLITRRSAPPAPAKKPALSLFKRK